MNLTIEDEQPTLPAVQGDAVEHDAGPLEILRQAVELGRDAETVQRLLDMRKELKAEWSREQFFSALAQFQAEIPEIPKVKKVKDKSGKVRYSYAPIEVVVRTVKPYLLKHGFSYTMKPTQQTDSAFTAVISVHHKDGHSEESSFTVPIDKDAYMNAPQRVGSARTYSMRFAFENALGLMTSDEDDDAQSFPLAAFEELNAELAAIRSAENIDDLFEAFKAGYTAYENEEARKILTEAKNTRKKELAQ